MNNFYISSLIWEDGVPFLSETEESLKCYQNMWTKTKCMIFNKSVKFYRKCFKINKGMVSTTNKYKYLGFIVTPSGEITTGLRDLKDRALNAYYSLENRMGQYFRMNIDTTLHLFDSLVKPILLYNSDFWGWLKMPKITPLKMYTCGSKKNCWECKNRKVILGGVPLVLGRVPLTLFANKNWFRINNGNAN